MGKYEIKLSSLSQMPEVGELFGIELSSISQFKVFHGFKKDGEEIGKYYKGIDTVTTDMVGGYTICEFIGDGVCVDCLSGVRIRLLGKIVDGDVAKYDYDVNFKGQDCSQLVKRYEDAKDVPLAYNMRINVNDGHISNFYKVDDGLKCAFGQQDLDKVSADIRAHAICSLNTIKADLDEISAEEEVIARVDNFIYDYQKKKTLKANE